MARSIPPYLEEMKIFYQPPTFLPPYSPNLKLLNYILGGVLKEKFQSTAYTDVEVGKQSIRRQWCSMSGDYMSSTFIVFCCRLEQVTAGSGDKHQVAASGHSYQSNLAF